MSPSTFPSACAKLPGPRAVINICTSFMLDAPSSRVPDGALWLIASTFITSSDGVAPRLFSVIIES